MQLTITFNPRDVIELRSALETISGLYSAASGQGVTLPPGGETYEGTNLLNGKQADELVAGGKAERGSRGPKPQAQEPAAPAPAATEASTGTETPAAADAPAVTLEDVTAVTLALGKAGKRDDIQALLAKYGAARASLIPQDKWAAYVADAKAVLG